MNKFSVKILACALVLATIFLFVGCNSTLMTQLNGRWTITEKGDSTGANMGDPDMNVNMDLYLDGRVQLYGVDVGTFTVSRNTFKFTSKDGEEYDFTGSFVMEYPDLYLYMDDENVSYHFEKTNNRAKDGSLLESYE